MALKTLRGRVAFIFEEQDFDVDQIVGVKNIKIDDSTTPADTIRRTWLGDASRRVGARV